MNETEQMIRKAGRPRSAQSHQAILEATLALFAEEGLQGLSIEAIAERARVGKTTIYRRWSSKEDVIKDALNLFRADNPIPDTGNIRNDLLYIAKESRELFTELIDPDAQQVYDPEAAVDALLRGIGTQQCGQPNDANTKRSK